MVRWLGKSAALKNIDLAGARVSQVADTAVVGAPKDRAGLSVALIADTASHVASLVVSRPRAHVFLTV